jgi:hypothetical protein
VPSPDPGTSGYIGGVAAASAGSAWAVGWTDSVVTVSTLILRWNGTSWTQVAGPGLGTGEAVLLGVAAVSPGAAWAVGTDHNATAALILRWNGTAWH